MPIMLVMETSEPVTGRTKATVALQLFMPKMLLVLPIPIQELAFPEALLLYASEELGLPMPV